MMGTRGHACPPRKSGWVRARARLAGTITVTCLAALTFAAQAVASTATYTATETIPVPPASTFAGSAGGDGWSVALSNTQVFNVFHHNGALQVACHNQSDASDCWPDDPTTIVDQNGNGYTTSGHPGLYLDPTTNKLYVYATRPSDGTGGVVCIDVSNPTSDPTFCGFTALTAVGDAYPYGFSALSAPMHVGDKLYSFNYYPGQGVGSLGGTTNELLCFDLSTDSACQGQPYTVNVGLGGGTMNTSLPSPATAAIGGKLFIPLNNGSSDLIACYDPSTGSNCSGSWPITLGFPFAGDYGSPFAMLDASGNVTGLCLPTSSAPCYDLTGASVATPAALPGALSAGYSASWDGPGLTIGPRVYVPEWVNAVGCFDYSTGASCAGFPKTFNNLGLLYTVNQDPQRPTCIWVNSDDGSEQIQNFDAYTGGPCGQGQIRVLASQFVVNTPLCTPAGYTKLQVIQPAANTYSPTTSSIEFDDGDANAITSITPNPQFLDATGAVSLVGMGLNTATGLPQFAISLNGVSGTPGSVEVQLTWTGTYDQSCVGPNTTVTNDNDLALTGVPSNITTNATGPSGAAVSYTPPTATDGTNAAPSVTCDHASGSTFPIGVTTVTCSASDADDTNSPVSAQFTVTVKGALDQLTALKLYVTGLGPGTSLPDKVQSAIQYDGASDIADTCTTLSALIKEVMAQAGKALTSAQASYIITTTTRIQAVLGCSSARTARDRAATRATRHGRVGAHHRGRKRRAER